MILLNASYIYCFANLNFVLGPSRKKRYLKPEYQSLEAEF